MRKTSKFVTATVAVVMFAMSSMPVFAVANDVKVKLPANQLWSVGYSDDHNPKYSTIAAKCNAVYPDSGEDTFTQIQFSADYLDGSSWVTVTTTPYETLTEGKGYETMHLRDGYLDIQDVWFKFRGKASHSANAVVSYDGSYAR